MSILNVTVHSLHIIFAAFWLGSLLYTELVLWPRLRAVGHLQTMQGALRTVQVRQQVGVAIIGTTVTGFARGALDGVFARLFTTYGVLFLVAAIVATATTVWWVSFPTRDRKIGWRMFYSSFFLIFALMVAMRFMSVQ